MKQLLVLFLSFLSLQVQAGDRYNFNAAWKLAIGDVMDGTKKKVDDTAWKTVTLPYAWNQSEAYSRNCSELSDTVVWYRKHFDVPSEWKGKKIFIEFEGARFAAQVFLNGKKLGLADNGVMAFGFDLTPYIKYGKENVLSVRVDNDWRYHEERAYWDETAQKFVHSEFQWNNKNFYCNYGGINKNVWLHVMNDVYQTLPLYSNLRTTGVYVAPILLPEKDSENKEATIYVESQVINSSSKPKTMQHFAVILNKEGVEVGSRMGDKLTIAPGDTVKMKSIVDIPDVHLWSWGYGYLYTVKSILLDVSEQNAGGKVYDVATIQTGFRKTEYKNGMFYLNDRVLQLKGFAQRSTNEWPAVGISLPAWMTDYSNSQILGCNGNFVRWMHVTPSKQDVRSFDRLGLIQAMPAGDAEKDVTGRRWGQRLELMRDAIIYNRNNPSILFYEGGNNQISEEHMKDLIALRDIFDPIGGRAIGSRNMLDSKVAEYGGEMLYVNKSAGKPMWQMEYNRDEGIRRYWDQWSYPYHKEGEGPLYRGDRTVSYNHNQDGLAIENIVRWNEYWVARPGTGRRVNSGGAKIIFSDSNTHARGEKNYRTSGDMDAMRIPKDSWFVHQALWDGWVDTEKEHTYIIGHWNYENLAQMEGARGFKPVYVCSTADDVELFLNGKSLGKGKRTNNFLFTFDNVKWQPGTLRAVGYKAGKEVSSYEISTIDEPVALRMRWIGPGEMKDGQWVNSTSASNMFKADGADLRIAEIEAVDAKGRRHPLAHDMIRFSVNGECEYLGGVSGVVSEEEKKLNASDVQVKEGHSSDTNGIGSDELMLEAGVIRVLVRSTTTAGNLTLTATALPNADTGKTLPPATLSASTVSCPVKGGFYVDASGKMLEADAAKKLPSYLSRGETPSTPSYTQKYKAVKVTGIAVAVNMNDATKMLDDNEDSRWSSDENLDHSWVKFDLEHAAAIRKISLRLNNFRTTSYPLQVFAGNVLVWEGYTPKTLGDCYLNIENPVVADQYVIKMIGPATVKEAFASMTELAAKQKVSTKESKSNTLSIIEIEFDE